MVVYTLSCENAHRFEGWFASPEAFSHQHGGGHLFCPVCGSSTVAKLPSAPYVSLPKSEPVKETAPERPIRGQASREEVDELREEGIEVVALPISPVPPEQLH